MSVLNLTGPAPAPAPARAGMLSRIGGALRTGAGKMAAATLRATSAPSYTQRVLTASHKAATGELAGETETAARELAGRKIGRIFQSARIKTDAPALREILTPACLSYIARRTAMDGGAALLMYWRAMNSGVLVPAEYWEIDHGGPDPNTWTYLLSIPSPSGTRSEYYPRADVFHVAQDLDPTEPWYGTAAGGTIAAAQVPARARRGLATEHAMPSNRLIPTPRPPGGKSDKDKARKAMEQGIVDGAGVFFPQSTQAAFVGDRGLSGYPVKDWNPVRMGPEPTQPQLDSWLASEAILLAAHGIHPSMMDPRAPAAAVKEARRQLQEEVEGMARLIEAETDRMFGGECKIWWEAPVDTELIQARTADALAKMGVDEKQALAAAGWREDFDVKPPPPKPGPAPPPKTGGNPNA